MDNWMHSLISVAMAIVGLAIIAVLVSNRAKTAQVIQSASTGFGRVLQAATSPYSGTGNGMGLTGVSFTGGSPISDMLSMA